MPLREPCVAGVHARRDRAQAASTPSNRPPLFAAAAFTASSAARTSSLRSPSAGRQFVLHRLHAALQLRQVPAERLARGLDLAGDAFRPLQQPRWDLRDEIPHLADRLRLIDVVRLEGALSSAQRSSSPLVFACCRLSASMLTNSSGLGGLSRSAIFLDIF
jgi:hypothetical protein